MVFPVLSKVKDLSTKGKSIRKTAGEMLLDRKTVKKYIESDGKWSHGSKGVKRESKLDDYKDLVKKMHIDESNSKVK